MLDVTMFAVGFVAKLRLRWSSNPETEYWFASAISAEAPPYAVEVGRPAKNMSVESR